MNVSDLGVPIPPAPAAWGALGDCIIYRCIIGSQAYGLAREGSDLDWRGLYLPPAERHWSLAGVPEQLEDEATQACYWELEKFLRLLLQGNPMLLECLYTPLLVEATPLGLELRDSRGRFLSKRLYRVYSGYFQSKFRLVESQRVQSGVVQWKTAMHLVRLLRAGIACFREGAPLVDMSSYREELLAIRDGQVEWAQVDERCRSLLAELEAAFAGTALPEHPDEAWADQFLIRARRSAVTSGSAPSP
jgi:hypothetical protein